MTASRNKKPMRGKTAKDDDTFDASPDPNNSVSKTDDLRQSPAWQKGKSGIGRMWERYLQILSQSFSAMDREEQENMITKFCYVITIGIACVIISCFYSLLPALLRIIALPIFLAGGWFVGAKIVAPTMIKRLERYLNPPY